MAPVAPRRRRARPVADAPIDSLLARAEDLAKGWLLALLEQAPLHEAPQILNVDLTRDGPRVCDAALRALADDADLRRLAPGGALRPLAGRVGELAGAGGAPAVSRAVDALQGVLWSALRDELRGAADPDLVSELAERLALVGELLRGAALERVGGSGAPGGSRERELAAVPRRERPPPGPPPPGPPPPSPPPPGSPRAPDAEPPPAASGALWVGALEDEIRRAPGGPLSLLLAELEDADRVVASAGSERAGTTFGHFAQAVRSVVRRQDILVCESDARAWVIARDTARAGAHALGVRIAEAVGEGAGWGGAPLQASVGVAVLGEDGGGASELMEAAEEARFGASARGVEVARRVPGPDG